MGDDLVGVSSPALDYGNDSEYLIEYDTDESDGLSEVERLAREFVYEWFLGDDVDYMRVSEYLESQDSSADAALVRDEATTIILDLRAQLGKE